MERQMLWCEKAMWNMRFTLLCFSSLWSLESSNPCNIETPIYVSLSHETEEISNQLPYLWLQLLELHSFFHNAVYESTNKRNNDTNFCSCLSTFSSLWDLSHSSPGCINSSFMPSNWFSSVLYPGFLLFSEEGLFGYKLVHHKQKSKIVKSSCILDIY